ncbi:MAG: hypothetical protein GY861_29360 [bacterium]|nr:hypothetical protein [bacterium]
MKKKLEDWNFKPKHLVYLVIAGCLGAMGYSFGSSISEGIAEHLTKPERNTRQTRSLRDTVITEMRRTNGVVVHYNEIVTKLDEFPTKQDLKDTEDRLNRAIDRIYNTGAVENEDSDEAVTDEVAEFTEYDTLLY